MEHPEFGRSFSVFTLLAVTILLSIPARAHNVVCGVSVSAFHTQQMNTKWDADSAAIRGISAFWAAIADLQSVNVEIAIQSTPSAGKSVEVSKLEDASTQFKTSKTQFEDALQKANQLVTPTNPLDNFGTQSIELWQKMIAFDKAFSAALDEGSVPDLHSLHDAIDTVQRLVNLGMRASVMHLNQQREFHTSGGPTVKFK